MIEYFYSDLKGMEFININHHEIIMNGMTIFNIDELHFHEVDNAYVSIRFLNQNQEIASMNMLPSEKLICDEDNNYFIVPVEGMEI